VSSWSVTQGDDAHILAYHSSTVNKNDTVTVTFFDGFEITIQSSDKYRYSIGILRDGDDIYSCGLCISGNVNTSISVSTQSVNRHNISKIAIRQSSKSLLHVVRSVPIS
jgi:hypothetical protein